MKTITNTLLIVAIFTSNVIASQPCMGTQCLASFTKPVAYKVTPTFKSDLVKEKTTNEIQESTYQEIIISEGEVTNQQDEIKTFEEVIDVMAIEPFEEIVVSEEVIDVMAIEPFEEIIVFEEVIEDNQKLTTNIEKICTNGQDITPCDITNESTDNNECVVCT